MGTVHLDNNIFYLGSEPRLLEQAISGIKMPEADVHIYVSCRNSGRVDFEPYNPDSRVHLARGEDDQLALMESIEEQSLSIAALVLDMHIDQDNLELLAGVCITDYKIHEECGQGFFIMYNQHLFEDDMTPLRDRINCQCQMIGIPGEGFYSIAAQTLADSLGIRDRSGIPGTDKEALPNYLKKPLTIDYRVFCGMLSKSSKDRMYDLLQERFGIMYLIELSSAMNYSRNKINLYFQSQEPGNIVVQLWSGQLREIQRDAAMREFLSYALRRTETNECNTGDIIKRAANHGFVRERFNLK